jgi:hypothetical protein
VIKPTGVVLSQQAQIKAERERLQKEADAKEKKELAEAAARGGSFMSVKRMYVC